MTPDPHHPNAFVPVDPAVDRGVQRLIRAGVAGGVGGGVLLWVLGGMPPVSAVWLGLLLLTLPVVSRAQVILLGDFVPPRSVMYTGTAATLVILGLVSLALTFFDGVPGGAGLLAPLALSIFVPEALGVTLAALGAMSLARWIETRLGVTETAMLRGILPRGGGERWGFAGLSLAAGTGEEMAYRGFAMFWLAALTGSPMAAAVLSSLAFGALHAYQGLFGIARAGSLGLILAWSVLRTGSLWPAMVAHAGLDLLVGLVLQQYFVGPDPAPARAAEAGPGAEPEAGPEVGPEVGPESPTL